MSSYSNYALLHLNRQSMMLRSQRWATCVERHSTKLFYSSGNLRKDRFLAAILRPCHHFLLGRKGACLGLRRRFLRTRTKSPGDRGVRAFAGSDAECERADTNRLASRVYRGAPI